MAKPPSSATIRGARFALFFTGAAWLAYFIEQAARLSQSGFTVPSLVESSVYVLLVSLLTLSASAYLFARIGYFERIRSHRRVPRSSIDDLFDQSTPSLTVLVPSYREDTRVVRQTLLTAALQEYPDLRIVLLIDDPVPGNAEQARSLERAKALPAMVEHSLEVPRRMFDEALAAFQAETTNALVADSATLELLARHYDNAAQWLASEKESLPRIDHTDEFLVIEIFERLRDDFHATAAAIRAAAQDTAVSVSRRRVNQLYLRLVRTFQAELTSFQRKQYESLSHEPNKAMNLNTYLGLMGGTYCNVDSPGGRVLVPAGKQAPDLVLPDSDYVLTLDADSMLLPEYCLRLVYHMEQKENADVAVAQTPYSAYRGAPSSIERIAGATTDIQHIVHQGLTSHDATFWVGANAVIRKSALEQLEEQDNERGFVIRRYIKDRTVIEDTESSIDLRSHGWRLYNYPERLSYSATPPDFGSLVIQRRRWSNGGLVILPSLVRLFFRPGKEEPHLSLAEAFLRTNYLASISWASVGLLLLLLYPFDGALLSRLALLTALPYFWAMANDLHRLGYRWSDIFRVYGFNLLLLPVNLTGTWNSIAQAIGGQKPVFARTPKVRNRTVAPLIFVTMPLLLVAWSAYTLQLDIANHTYAHGVFAATNLTMTAYACIAFVGFHGILSDVSVNLRAFLYRPATRAVDTQMDPHWASVLYVGNASEDESEQSGLIAFALAAQDRLNNGLKSPDEDRIPEHFARSKSRSKKGIRGLEGS